MDSFRLKDASLEIDFDFNFELDKPLAGNAEPLLLLIYDFAEIAVHLNYVQDLKVMQFHRDLSYRFGGYWTQLISTKACNNHAHADLVRMHGDAVSPEKNSTHFYVGIQNKERIVVLTKDGTCVAKIRHNVYQQKEEIKVWIDPKRVGAMDNLAVQDHLHFWRQRRRKGGERVSEVRSDNESSSYPIGI